MDTEKELFQQIKLFTDLQTKVGCEAWFIAFKNLPYNGGFYSVLIKNSNIEKSMEDPSWDLSLGQGLPSCTQYGSDLDGLIEYNRYGTKGIQPLVYWRNFYGVKPPYIEISEEFRHYHNLYHDVASNKYIKIDDNGDEEDIIIIEDDNTVKIKLKAIKQFLAIKEMSLLFLFDSFYYSEKSLEELNIKQMYAKPIKVDGLTYSISFGEVDWGFNNYKSLSRLNGKKLIIGFSKEYCGIWPYNGNIVEEFDDFVIGVDDNGCDITYTSNPDKLGDYFGSNPEAPHYLTPVYFKKEVLNKYYNAPDKYTVNDGYISCAGLWGIKVDNDKKDYVVVFLGDLGRDLSHKERLYWKSFNVPPDNSGISKTCWKRSFEAEFWNPESADLKFKHEFLAFNEAWRSKYDWDLFIPLTKDDFYHYKTLRIPLNNQNNFEEQVRGLVKIIIDSINVKKIDTIIAANPDGSINKLEQFFKERGLKDYDKHISFLRDLQNLRSAAVAHRKGDNYVKSSKKFAIGNKPYDEIFESILDSINLLLEFLRNNFL